MTSFKVTHHKNITRASQVSRHSTFHSTLGDVMSYEEEDAYLVSFNLSFHYQFQRHYKFQGLTMLGRYSFQNWGEEKEQEKGPPGA